MTKQYVSHITVTMSDIDPVPQADVDNLGGRAASLAFIREGVEAMLNEHDVYDYFKVDIAIELREEPA